MEFTAEMIAGLLGGTIVGDKSTAVHTVSSIDGGKKGALAYLTNPKYEQFAYTTEASIVLVNNDFEPKDEVKATLIKLPDVGAAVLQLLEMYNAMKPQKKGISKMASISEKATIGENCYIGDFAVVEAGAVIGDGAKIYPQC
ncbi:MAG: UDP-3-O-(3-hydroxymyristoyl)glucosamine N-acyltransferase, partial [Alistipes sp.]|nr:UDP-3-O-(3-hydroxymyristoyl)glucosamine N-acyltransferase [Alistipes sp.]